MARAPLTDDVLAEMMPGLTSTTLVSLRRADVVRGGSPEAVRLARAPAPAPAPQSRAAQHRSAEPATHADADWFDDRVLAASEDVPTVRLERTKRNPAEVDTEILRNQAAGAAPGSPASATPAPPATAASAPDAADATGVEKRRKPTDSFTLNPAFASRVFDSCTIEILDPRSGDHISFVRGVLVRDAQDQVIKIQCYLTRGTYLAPMGTKLEFRLGTERFRIRDGFYVTPRGGRGDEWMYLGYVG